MHKIVQKIDKLRYERGWSVYKLSIESDTSQQTLQKWFDKGATPTLPILEKVCGALGVSLAEVFAENNLVEISEETKKLYDEWCCLTKEEQSSIKQIMRNYIKNKQN